MSLRSDFGEASAREHASMPKQRRAKQHRRRCMCGVLMWQAAEMKKDNKSQPKCFMAISLRNTAAEFPNGNQTNRGIR